MNPSMMQLAINQARQTMRKQEGGPFGAVILDQTGKVLAVASNSVLKDFDPTAHAEINAIRQACASRKNYDLSGCILYTTCYPCPMCLSAIVWANIKTVIYGCTSNDASAIGFKDEPLYTFLKQRPLDQGLVVFIEQGREECLALFDEYARSGNPIY
ncbi:MAG: nucleoside deaminase [Erysipelotrichaceae bacterium]